MGKNEIAYGRKTAEINAQIAAFNDGRLIQVALGNEICPVKVFCNTRIAVGPMGTEAHTPIVKALRSSSNIIRAALRVLPSVNGPYFRNGM